MDLTTLLDQLKAFPCMFNMAAGPIYIPKFKIKANSYESKIAAAFDKTQAIQVMNTWTWLVYTVQYSQEGLKEALELNQNAKDKASDSINEPNICAMANMAYLKLEQGELAECEHVLVELKQLRSRGDFEAMMTQALANQGYALLRLLENTAAIQAFKKVVQQSPTDYISSFMLAQLYTRCSTHDSPHLRTYWTSLAIDALTAVADNCHDAKLKAMASGFLSKKLAQNQLDSEQESGKYARQAVQLARESGDAFALYYVGFNLSESNSDKPDILKESLCIKPLKRTYGELAKVYKSKSKAASDATGRDTYFGLALEMNKKNTNFTDDQSKSSSAHSNTTNNNIAFMLIQNKEFEKAKAILDNAIQKGASHYIDASAQNYCWTLTLRAWCNMMLRETNASSIAENDTLFAICLLSKRLFRDSEEESSLSETIWNLDSRSNALTDVEVNVRNMYVLMIDILLGKKGKWHIPFLKNIMGEPEQLDDIDLVKKHVAGHLRARRPDCAWALLSLARTRPFLDRSWQRDQLKDVTEEAMLAMAYLRLPLGGAEQVFQQLCEGHLGGLDVLVLHDTRAARCARALQAVLLDEYLMNATRNLQRAQAYGSSLRKDAILKEVNRNHLVIVILTNQTQTNAFKAILTDLPTPGGPRVVVAALDCHTTCPTNLDSCPRVDISRVIDSDNRLHQATPETDVTLDPKDVMTLFSDLVGVTWSPEPPRATRTFTRSAQRDDQTSFRPQWGKPN